MSYLPGTLVVSTSRLPSPIVAVTLPPMHRFSLRGAALLAVAASSLSVAQAQGSAEYRVTFDATWSNQTHPNAFIGSAHFSPLIGASHSSALEVWAPGGIASSGIEQMAETGGTSILTQEVNAAIGAGTALERILGGGVGISPGTASGTFTATTEFPLVSLVTMIAPSPDWFVGVHGVSMVENGQFVDDLTIQLFAYDSGTDSGANFTSPNQNTNPQQPISLLTAGPFTGATALGTFRFERLHSSLVYGAGNPAGSLELVAGEPRVGQSLTIAIDDPTASFGAPAPTFLAIAGAPDAAFPGGTILPGFGLGPVGTPGELLIGGPFVLQVGPTWSGAPSNGTLPIPSSPSLVGIDVYLQGVVVDLVQLRSGLTRGLELHIGA